MTRWRRAVICAACVVLWTASGPASAGQAQSAPRGAAPNGPDAEVRDYRLHALDARVRSLAPGAERDYLAGVLASRRGRTEESIPLLTRALPGLRDSQPRRAAIALEALAEGYVSSYRYREAARAYDDLEQHFARYQGHDVADDAALARTAEKASGVPMFMRGLSPVIECDVNGQRLLFTFDTGASSTDFSVRYFNLFRQHRGTWQTRTVESGGAGGTVRRKMYIQPEVVVKVGNATATLKDVTIFSTPMNAGIDVLFGNIGQDLVAGFESFTVDFAGMMFGLGPPSPR